MATRFRIAEGDRFPNQVTSLAHIANANKIVKEKLTPTHLAMFKRTIFGRFVNVDMVFNSPPSHVAQRSEEDNFFAQLAIAGAMPLPYFAATPAVVASGLLINFMNYFNVLSIQILKFWEDFITVGGFSILPQVMWSTFVPFIPNSILPGVTALVAALLAVALARAGKLLEKGVKVVGALSGWTATLLFMWMPVSQMVFILFELLE
ncbi:maltose excess protein 1-like, chloroplastic [Benincasa hispida]|uniref:maltose excess protein 1-like, chloroplastic n=1 Tax=Benincasa hispida TaxID=102211 RepID=UPI00190204B9|nr:maltose excess protein 1-like, chloroplastic [Benincasa hispida]